MKKVRSLEATIQGVLLSALIFAAKTGVDKNSVAELLKKYFNVEVSKPVNHISCILLCTIIFFLLNKLFKELYERFLWKLIYPKLNLNGKWKYENSYADGSPQTVGEILIKQTPYELEMIEGKSTAQNPHTSYTNFKALSFKTDTELYGCYEVTMQSQSGGMLVTKKSVEIFNINQYKKFLFFKKPVLMNTNFFNCVATSDEKQNAKASKINNIEKIGTCTYTRL